MKRLIQFFMLLLVLSVSIPYIYSVWGLKSLDAEAKSLAPGIIASLEAGEIHYEMSGPENGPLVMLVHGFSTPSFAFNQTTKGLVDNGYRVLWFDHFGRGWSDRPQEKYSTDFYDKELIQLLDFLEINTPIHIVGYSMGGVIVSEFAVRHPEKIKSVVLLASAGLESDSSEGMLLKLVKMPFVGDWIWTVFGRSVLVNDPQYQNKPDSKDRRLQGNIETQMKYEGYFPALLSTIRHLPMSDRSETFRLINEMDIPVAAIFGTADQTIEVSCEKQIKKLVPNVETTLLEGADHGLPYKNYKQVNSILTDFFQRWAN